MTGRDTAAASLKPTAPRLCARRVHAYMSLTKKGDGQVPIDKGLLRWRALQHRRHSSAEGTSRERLPMVKDISNRLLQGCSSAESTPAVLCRCTPSIVSHSIADLETEPHNKAM